ncbi:plasmid segregation protein ParM domain-containing protein, partial [Escherichia coli]
MKICIDDGSTNTKLAWTENGERRNAISPNSFKSEWSAPFGGTQPANYMLDGVRYGFDPVSDRFVQTTDTQYQYSDVNVIAIHHALVKSGITPQEVDVVVTLPLSEYFDTNAQPDIANINRKKANDARMLQAYRIAQAALQAKPSDGLVRAVRFYEQVKRENPPVE